MAKCIIFLLICVLFASFVYSAIELPQNYKITVKAYEESQHNFIIKNKYDYKLYDVKFAGLPGFNFPVIDLEPNSEQIINYTIYRNDTGDFNYNAEISYKYEVDLPIEDDVHNVEIKADGFHPSFITIRKGDTIIWYNNDTITRTITTSSFDESIAPNDTLRKEFNDLGTINYQDLSLFHGGTISIVNDTQGQLVSNPDLNINWQVGLTVFLENTTLEISNNRNNYSIEINDTAQGLIEIKNIGNEIAENVKLSSEPGWISFEKNNFDIESGKNVYVVYHISPLVFESSQTNITHNISLKVVSDNTQPHINNLSIFVPYRKDFDDLGSAEGFLSLYDKYCRANPNTLLCNNTIGQSSEPKIIYRDPEIPINITQKEVYAMLRKQAEVMSSFEVTNNEIKKVFNTISNDLPQIKEELSDIKGKQLELEQERSTGSTVTWLIILFGILITSANVIGFVYMRYNKRKERGF